MPALGRTANALFPSNCTQDTYTIYISLKSSRPGKRCTGPSVTSGNQSEFHHRCRLIPGLTPFPGSHSWGHREFCSASAHQQTRARSPRFSEHQKTASSTVPPTAVSALGSNRR